MHEWMFGVGHCNERYTTPDQTHVRTHTCVWRQRIQITYDNQEWDIVITSEQRSEDWRKAMSELYRWCVNEICHRCADMWSRAWQCHHWFIKIHKDTMNDQQHTITARHRASQDCSSHQVHHFITSTGMYQNDWQQANAVEYWRQLSASNTTAVSLSQVKNVTFSLLY